MRHVTAFTIERPAAQGSLSNDRSGSALVSMADPVPCPLHRAAIHGRGLTDLLASFASPPATRPCPRRRAVSRDRNGFCVCLQEGPQEHEKRQHEHGSASVVPPADSMAYGGRQHENTNGAAKMVGRRRTLHALFVSFISQWPHRRAKKEGNRHAKMRRGHDSVGCALGRIELRNVPHKARRGTRRRSARGKRCREGCY
jgi:hypothetical protein